MTQQHTHKYERATNGKSTVYRCMHPECRHYLRPEFVIGQRTVCRYCDNDFIIQKNTIGSPKRRKKYMQCGCQNKKKNEKVETYAIDELLKGVL